MKQNDIFRLALQAGFKEGDLSLFPSLLTKFADLVAAEVGIAQWHRGFSEGQSVERAVCAKELRRLHAENEALRAQIGQGEPIGWLYDWTHSSALGKPDEQFTSFTNDEVHAHKHSNVRPVFDKQSTAPQQKPMTDEQQIAEALRKHGFALVKTAT